jgi:replicative DNA helicase Mcm
VSGAGLCVAPSSMVLTNPGGIMPIERLVEDRLDDPEAYREEVWRKGGITDVTVQSMTDDLRIRSLKPDYVWKLRAPEVVFKVKLSSGKRIELTGNTQLYCIRQGYPMWVKGSMLSSGDYVATPRRLVGGDKIPGIISLIKSNPVVHGIKPAIKELARKLSKKHGTLRKASKVVGLSEGNLYYNWVNEHARGNIKLSDLKKISADLSIDCGRLVKRVSLYNGKVHSLPKDIDCDLVYVAGLVAGDGDIRKSGSSYSIRLSNSCKTLQRHFRDTVSMQFGLRINVTPGCRQRPEASRAHSVLLAEILFSLGLCTSPKSTRIHMSDTLLHMPDTLLAHYIAGLYDSDGSVQCRTGGSDCIEVTTCSETLARQLQLVFLRYGIHAKLRDRPPSKGRICGRHRKWVLDIRGNAQIRRFQEAIRLRHPKKASAVRKIVEKGLKTNTNIDIIPGIGHRIDSILKRNGYRGCSHNISRDMSQKLLSRLRIEDPELENVRTLAFADIFWEQIVDISVDRPAYDYVYDLTVGGAHNFVVDGVLVHNTATVVRDEFLSGWSLEAGALVLANRGVVMIDELDKMSDDDRAAMHEGLEQQTISISKANIQATLRCETTVLAAANPKFGRFDPYDPIAKQIDLPPTLINRFDLIFTIKDLPDEEKDAKMAGFILEMHKTQETKGADIDTDMLRKYLVYSRQRIKPRLTDGAVQELRDYYIKMRSTGAGDEGTIKTIPISARQLEALVRLAEAAAKLRMSDKVTRKDAKDAVALLHYCLEQVGLDPETGKIDIDRITTGITTTERNKIIVVREIIGDLEQKIGKAVPVADVIAAAAEKGLSEDDVDDAIEKLKRSGDIFQPRKDSVSRI